MSDTLPQRPDFDFFNDPGDETPAPFKLPRGLDRCDRCGQFVQECTLLVDPHDPSKAICEKCNASDNDEELDLEYTLYPTQPETVTRVTVDGYLPANDIRRAFVMGAKWWEYHSTGFTMFGSDRNLAEAEAEKRYPGGTSTDAEELDTLRYENAQVHLIHASNLQLMDELIAEHKQVERLREQLTAARAAYARMKAIWNPTTEAEYDALLELGDELAEEERE